MAASETKRKIAEAVVKGGEALRIDRPYVASIVGVSPQTVGRYFDEIRDELTVRHTLEGHYTPAESDKPELVRGFIFIKLLDSTTENVRNFRKLLLDTELIFDFYIVEGTLVDCILRISTESESKFVGVHESIARMDGVEKAEIAHRIREEFCGGYTELSVS